MYKAAILLLPLLALAASAQFLIPETQLQIVLIGSSDSERKEYVDAANLTVAKFFRTHFYTDVSLPTCEVCFNQQHLQEGTTYKGAWAEQIWSTHDRKWWCAQNRPIQVLQSLLPLLQQGNTLPDYLFVGDDDTWINPIRLVEQVKKLNPTKDLFIGYAHPHHKYPWGGAGYFIHKGLLLALLTRPDPHDARSRVEASTSMHEQMVTDHVARVSPQSVPEKSVLDNIYGPGLLQRQLEALGLKPKEEQAAAAAPAAAAEAATVNKGTRRLLQDAAPAAAPAAAAAAPAASQPATWLDICLQLKVGGRWCLWHSDWVIAECINLAAAVRPDVGGEARGLSYNSCRPDTLQNFLTCHHVPAAHYKALYGHMLANDESLRTFASQSNSTLMLNS